MEAQLDAAIDPDDPTGRPKKIRASGPRGGPPTHLWTKRPLPNSAPGEANRLVRLPRAGSAVGRLVSVEPGAGVRDWTGRCTFAWVRVLGCRYARRPDCPGKHRSRRRASAARFRLGLRRKIPRLPLTAVKWQTLGACGVLAPTRGGARTDLPAGPNPSPGPGSARDAAGPKCLLAIRAPTISAPPRRAGAWPAASTAAEAWGGAANRPLRWRTG
jgi:hypothetical protein